MTQSTIQLTIPLEVLVEAIKALSLEDKDRLLMQLEDMVAQEEEERFDSDPRFRAEMEQALADYEAGDYLTIEEYLAEQQED